MRAEHGRQFKRANGGAHPPAIELHLSGRYFAVTWEGLEDSRVELRVPAGSALRVTTRGGASRLRIGDMRLGSVGGRLDWQSPEYATSPDRYDLSVGGGADRLDILYVQAEDR